MGKNKTGFTLIELMVVIVIIGILAAIAIPNYFRVVNRAKTAEVKSNMHTTQLEVEYYCIESAGHNYPTSVDLITDELPGELKNPFIPGEAVVQDEDEADIAGVVEYATNSDIYTITGFGKDAVLLNIVLTPGAIR